MRLFAFVACLIVVGFGAAGIGASPGRPAAADGGRRLRPVGRGAPPRRAKFGTGHVLTGVVLSSLDCRALAGARIHLWQANRLGEYVRAGSATVVTDRAGRFRFEGPRPVGFDGRPPHIHIRVVAVKHELLFTRYVPRPGAKQGSMRSCSGRRLSSF